MTFTEAIEFIEQSKPEALYLGGKTSTGKSTFANELAHRCGYKIVELDKIVKASVIKAINVGDEGEAFFEVYKQRNHLDWIKSFIEMTKAEVGRLEAEGEPVIVEGAVAHPDTLRDLLAAITGIVLIYFHPKHLEVYERNLTSRFMKSSLDFNAGLPRQFWELVEPVAFDQFCKTHVLTEHLRKSIHEYAVQSQRDSERRLAEQSNFIKGMLVVEI